LLQRWQFVLVDESPSRNARTLLSMPSPFRYEDAITQTNERPTGVLTLETNAGRVRLNDKVYQWSDNWADSGRALVYRWQGTDDVLLISLYNLETGETRTEAVNGTNREYSVFFTPDEQYLIQMRSIDPHGDNPRMEVVLWPTGLDLAPPTSYERQHWYGALAPVGYLALLDTDGQYSIIDIRDDIPLDSVFAFRLGARVIWSPDTTAVIVWGSRADEPSPSFHILRLGSVVTSGDLYHPDSDPLWSFDGSTVYDWAMDTASNTLSLVRYDAFTGERTVITAGITHGHFSPDVTEAVVGMMEDDEFTLQRVDLATGARVMIARGEEWRERDDTLVEWSNDGSLITVINARERRMARLRHGDAAPELFTDLHDLQPLIGDNYVIWVDANDGQNRVWKTNLDTGTDTLLDTFDQGRSPRFAFRTHDRWIGYQTYENIDETRYHIVHLDDMRRLNVVLPSVKHSIMWPDVGAWIAPDGLGGVVRPLDGMMWWFENDGDAELLSSVMAIRGSWSPDSAAFAYLPDIEENIMTIRTRSGLHRGFRVPQNEAMPIWSPCDAVPRPPSF
jgi:hypothetical protein